MNTNSVENIILELDQISSLCSKIGSVYRSIDILESKKNAELEKTKKVREITINRSLRAFKEEQLAKLPEWNATHDYISTWPPTHWSYPSSSKRDFKTEKTLDSFSSPEMKEQIYNSFREYEKSFIKIMKVCEEKGKTEWDAFHAELAAINSKYEKMKEELDAKKDTLEMEMNKHTVISSDLFYLAGEISLLLKQKRADTLKEAINLAIDEHRKEEERAERHWHDREMKKLAEEEVRAKKEQAAATQYQADTMKATIEAQCNRCIKKSFCSHGLNRPLYCKDFERR